MGDFFEFANAYPVYATIISLAFIGLCITAVGNNKTIKTELFTIE